MRALIGLAAFLLLACGEGPVSARKSAAAIAGESGLKQLESGWTTAGEDHEKRDGGVDVYVLRGDKPLADLPGKVTIPADAAIKSIGALVKDPGEASSQTAESAAWGDWTAAQVVTTKGAWLWLQRIPPTKAPAGH